MRRMRYILTYLFGGFGGMAMMQIANTVAGAISPPRPITYIGLCSAVVSGSLALSVILADWRPNR